MATPRYSRHTLQLPEGNDIGLLELLADESTKVSVKPSKAPQNNEQTNETVEVSKFISVIDDLQVALRKVCSDITNDVNINSHLTNFNYTYSYNADNIKSLENISTLKFLAHFLVDGSITLHNLSKHLSPPKEGEDKPDPTKIPELVPFNNICEKRIELLTKIDEISNETSSTNVKNNKIKKLLKKFILNTLSTLYSSAKYGEADFKATGFPYQLRYYRSKGNRPATRTIDENSNWESHDYHMFIGGLANIVETYIAIKIFPSYSDYVKFLNTSITFADRPDKNDPTLSSNAFTKVTKRKLTSC